MTRQALVVLLLLAGLAAALAAEPDWYYANLDSMPRLPTNKLFYLEQKAGLCPKPTDDGESLNVRLVGKWGGGPSWGVTGKDTLVYLSRGSEVVVINFADTAQPQILNYIQAKRLAGRPVLVDTLLYLVTSGYIEVFNVKDPTNAPRVGRLATPVADIDVEDTLVYSISDDTFRVFDFADPANPHLVGACADSGYALDFDGGYAYLRDRWGMYILDVRDPANPHRVASWGTDIAGVKVRGNHCYVAQGSMGSGSLHVLNVSNPTSPWQEGVLSGLTGEDIYLVDTLLFLPGFDVVNVADSSRPTLVATTFVGGPRLGVWADDSLRLGFVAADYVGLHALSLASVANPVLDTTILGVGEALDISVAGQLACVACFRSDAVLFDISDPTAPREVGRYSAPGYVRSVLNAESLAYVPAFGQTHDTVLHAVDITDPSNPVKVGSAGGWEDPRAMVLRDSFLYCAEAYRFEVFNVANPRQPVWMGRCDLTTWRGGLALQDTFAYVAPDIQIINIARPDQPTRVSSTPCSAWDIALRDTVALIAHSRESLKVYSIADPYGPRRLSSTWVPGQARSVVFCDSYAHLGCDDFRVFDMADVASPELSGQYSTPYFVMSLDSDSQYTYAACYLAGVCVLEQLPVGVAEPQRTRLGRPSGSVGLSPNPVRRWARLEWDEAGRWHETQVLDAQGRVVSPLSLGAATDGQSNVDFGGLRPGVYFLRWTSGRAKGYVRFVKI